MIALNGFTLTFSQTTFHLKWSGSTARVTINFDRFGATPSVLVLRGVWLMSTKCSTLTLLAFWWGKHDDEDAPEAFLIELGKWKSLPFSLCNGKYFGGLKLLQMAPTRFNRLQKQIIIQCECGCPSIFTKLNSRCRSNGFAVDFFQLLNRYSCRTPLHHRRPCVLVQSTRPSAGQPFVLVVVQFGQIVQDFLFQRYPLTGPKSLVVITSYLNVMLPELLLVFRTHRSHFLDLKRDEKIFFGFLFTTELKKFKFYF